MSAGNCCYHSMLPAAGHSSLAREEDDDDDSGDGDVGDGDGDDDYDDDDDVGDDDIATTLSLLAAGHSSLADQKHHRNQ